MLLFCYLNKNINIIVGCFIKNISLITIHYYHVKHFNVIIFITKTRHEFMSYIYTVFIEVEFIFNYN